MTQDWEYYVNAVCVQGRPGQISALALGWEATFRNVGTVAQNLRDGIKDLKKVWKGPAADDYFGKLESIAKSIDKLVEDNQPIINLLKTAAEALATAQTTMPVPDYMLDDVQGRQAALDNANRAGAGGMLAMTGPVGIAADLLGPDAFLDGLGKTFVGDWGREVFGKIVSWFDDKAKEAEEIYNTADKKYLEGAAITGTPTTITPRVSHNTPVDLGSGGGSGVRGGPGGLGDSSFDPSTFGDTSGVGGFDPDSAMVDPSYGTGSSTGSGGAGSGYTPLSGSGLQSAGGGALSGLGSPLSSGGLGGGLGAEGAGDE